MSKAKEFLWYKWTNSLSRNGYSVASLSRSCLTMYKGILMQGFQLTGWF